VPVVEVNELPVVTTLVTLEMPPPVLVKIPDELVCAVVGVIVLASDVKRVVPRRFCRLEV
jgi:hypothetical protein